MVQSPLEPRSHSGTPVALQVRSKKNEIAVWFARWRAAKAPNRPGRPSGGFGDQDRTKWSMRGVARRFMKWSPKTEWNAALTRGYPVDVDSNTRRSVNPE